MIDTKEERLFFDGYLNGERATRMHRLCDEIDALRFAATHREGSFATEREHFAEQLAEANAELHRAKEAAQAQKQAADYFEAQLTEAKTSAAYWEKQVDDGLATIDACFLAAREFTDMKCLYCARLFRGEMEVGGAEAVRQAWASHVKSCEQHPMRAMEIRAEKAEAQLVATRDMLRRMCVGVVDRRGQVQMRELERAAVVVLGQSASLAQIFAKASVFVALAKAPERVAMAPTQRKGELEARARVLLVALADLSPFHHAALVEQFTSLVASSFSTAEQWAALVETIDGHLQRLRGGA